MIDTETGEDLSVQVIDTEVKIC